jgi:phage shock protein C
MIVGPSREVSEMTEVQPGDPGATADVVQPRLRRSRDDKVLAGVCGGMGRYFDTDPLWFRLGFVVVTLATGIGILAYLIAWIAIPEATEDEEVVPGRHGDQSQLPVIGGIVLVGLGLALLAEQLLPRLSDLMWPAAVVAAGIGLVFLGVRRDHE